MFAHTGNDDLAYEDDIVLLNEDPSRSQVFLELNDSVGMFAPSQCKMLQSSNCMR